ncbi:MAG: GIY-YIG nuclease family protein [Chloroflexi bacterium]|nr:GIY-YIG nuclease family protein [Chloroflexota bacterium]
MDRRKTLINEYKQGKIIGGIYRVTNTRNGMYLLDHATNLQSKQNSFNFMVSSGSCLDYRLKEDLTAFGDKAFIFEILEALEKKKEQTRDEFVDDLKMLEQLWSEKLDSSTRY